MDSTPPEPNEQQRPIKIANRSERIWIFGFLRMVPFLTMIGSIFILITTNLFRDFGAFAALGFLMLLVAVVILDRSTLLNPVDVVWLGEMLTIKRLVGEKKEIPIKRIRQVDISPTDTLDYDDRRQATVKVVFRLKYGRASMLAPLAAREPIIQWAKQHQRIVVDHRDTVASHEDV